jgi:hypothetical protein
MLEVVISEDEDSELSDLDELLWQPREDAKKKGTRNKH